jgi:predicted Zn finger-like uncharacterized protein
MKFECPSCAKKYSLPDEKVPAGKDFKVKCKKCGEIIVLRAPDPAEAMPAEEPEPPVEEQAPPAEEQVAPASQQAAAFGQPAEPGPFDQPEGGGPFDAQAGAPAASPDMGMAPEEGAPQDGAAAPDEQPTRVFDYSSMGAGETDPVQAATAQAEAFQAPQAEAFQAPQAEPPAQEEPPPAEAPAGGEDDLEWHIAVDGDQMGPYETAQMLEMMAANQITADTYVWRDGYDDWLPLSDVSELQGAGAPVAEPAPAPAPAAAAPGSPFAISSGGAGGQDLFAAAGSEGTADAASPFAAPSGDGGVSTSLDAAPQSPRVQATDLKGARHENSVLFSLSSLQALASSSRDPAPAAGLGAATSEGGSGLIDIRSLTAGASTATSDAAPSDDILSMGGGGIGSPVGVPSLLQPAKKEPSKLPYILAGVFGLVAIAGIAVVLVVVLGRDKPQEIDEAALRAQIMKELMTQKGMTKEEAAAQAKEMAAEQVAEAEAEGGSAEDEGEGEEESTSVAGKKKKKKKGGGGGGGGESGTSPTPPPVPSTGGGGGKKTAAEDDLMALLAGATKGSKKKPEKKDPGESPTKAPTPKPAADLPDKPTKQDVMKALNGVKPKVQACGKGQTGVATVSINIAGSTGKVASAKVVSGPFKGTPNASCIEKAVKKAKFSKFKQSKFSVSYPFVIK